MVARFDSSWNKWRLIRSNILNKCYYILLVLVNVWIVGNIVIMLSLIAWMGCWAIPYNHHLTTSTYLRKSTNKLNLDPILQRVWRNPFLPQRMAGKKSREYFSFTAKPVFDNSSVMNGLSLLMKSFRLKLYCRTERT